MSRRGVVLFLSAVNPRVIFACLLLGSLVPNASAERRESRVRPIEFGESTEANAEQQQVTNEQAFGAGGRRLRELEDDLARSLDFFSPQDSLGGVQIPSRLPRANVPRVRKPASDLFNTEESLRYSDPMEELRRRLDDIDEDRDARDASRDADRGSDSSSGDLFDELRAEDWLVKGAAGEAFWDIAVNAEPTDAFNQDPSFPGIDDTHPFGGGERPEPGIWGESDFQTTDSRLTSDSIWTQQDDSFGRQPAKPFRQQDMDQSPQEFRREEYRRLLGVSALQPTVSEPISTPAWEQSSLYGNQRSGVGNLGSVSQPILSSNPFGVPASSQPAAGALPSFSGMNSLEPVAAADARAFSPQAPSTFGSSDIFETLPRPSAASRAYSTAQQRQRFAVPSRQF